MNAAAEDKPRTSIITCRICHKLTFHERIVKLPDGMHVAVGRCTVCDTPECPKCESRTLNPYAKKCPHCGTEWGAVNKGQ